MQARLFCKTGPLAGTSYDVQGEVTIGKSPGNSIQLTPAIISGKHARIIFDPKKGAYFIEDLGSTNGTWVDGMRVKGKERLERLSVISFADTFDFVFQIVGLGVTLNGETPPLKPESVHAAKPEQFPKKAEQKTKVDEGGAFVPPPKSPGQPAPGRKTMMDDGGAFAPPPGIAGPPRVNERPKNATVFDDGNPIPQFVRPEDNQEKREGTPVLKYVLEVKSPDGIKSYDIKEGKNTIGREASCDVFVEDSSMSRKHAVIVLKSGELTINDLSSKNGTFIGSERVSTERKLRPGDALQFGNITARLSGKPAA